MATNGEKIPQTALRLPARVKRARLVMALLEGLSLAEAAKAAGLSYDRASDALHERETIVMLEQALKGLIEGTVTRIVGAVGLAIDRLEQALDSPNRLEAMRATEVLFHHGVRSMELLYRWLEGRDRGEPAGESTGLANWPHGLALRKPKRTKSNLF